MTFEKILNNPLQFRMHNLTFIGDIELEWT